MLQISHKYDFVIEVQEIDPSKSDNGKKAYSPRIFLYEEKVELTDFT